MFLNSQPLLLLLEDDPDEAHLLQWQLEQGQTRGFRVRVSESLTVFRHQVNTLSESPALLLVDLNLPDSSGVNTVAACRALLPDVPLVVHSGWLEAADQIALQAAGATACLIKGLEPEQLMTELLKLLEK